MLLNDTPTRLRLSPDVADVVKADLRYCDLRAEQEYKRFRHNTWYSQKYGQEAWKEKLEALKASRWKTLLQQDEVGTWTYSGLGASIAARVPHEALQSTVHYPPAKPVPWTPKGMECRPRYYQVEMLNKLLEARHAAVQAATGVGKSLVIAMLLKTLGLRATIMVPSRSIFQQLKHDLERLLGRHLVGGLGDGCRDVLKDFVVAIAASLTKIQPDCELWRQMAQRDVLVVDEAHMVPAQTLSRVCMELLAAAPYRFFLTGTHMRNDGLDKLLLGITGPVVYEMSVQRGVEEGWLARPLFRFIQTNSPSSKKFRDVNDETREHLLYNPTVCRTAAEVANRTAGLLRRPTLVLIEEVEQFGRMLPFFQHEVAFAHGGLTKDNRDLVPAAYHQSDPTELVERFNAGRLPILVGTTCIGMGTDIRVAEALIYLQGGKSEIQVRQAVGRGTRGGVGAGVVNPWTGQQKVDCLVFDFDVVNCETTHRHAVARRAIYHDVMGPVEDVWA